MCQRLDHVPDVLRIIRLGAQGDGVADTPDGPVHVPQALPGETWSPAPHRLLAAVPDRIATPDALCL